MKPHPPAGESFASTLVQVGGGPVGSLAALGHHSHAGAVNDGEVFVRDNVPAMLHLLSQGCRC
ncbi:MAG: glycoside hydrolase 100 family protein [Cyanobacteriota bacterium]|nr:glycoside hydrolase 100 family protein [Cyanobacteriota bacterium]